MFLFLFFVSIFLWLRECYIVLEKKGVHLYCGADLNARDDEGQTLLHTATNTRKIEVIHVLLDRGADINARDDKGQTPLHAATSGATVAIRVNSPRPFPSTPFLD